MSSENFKQLESIQSTSIKTFMGLCKWSRHTNLLKALNIIPIQDIITEKMCSLYNRCFKVQSPLVDVNTYFMSQYMYHGVTFKGTLVHRLVNLGVSPMRTAFNYKKLSVPYDKSDGVVDSLFYLIHCENYMKPWSSEYILTKLLTRSF